MTVLLVPGYMTDADLWRDVEDGLQALGPILHADLSQDASIPAMAQRALAQAPASFLLVGFSMGGYVAREMARLAPDRVAALVLVATSARGDSAAQAARKAAAVAQAVVSQAVSLSRSAVLSSLHPDHADDEELVARIQAMGARLGPEVFRRQTMLDRPSDLDRLRDIHCPTLILAGEGDRLRSMAEADELRDGIPGAELRVIPGTGHMIPLETPLRLLDEVMPWLASKGSPEPFSSPAP